MSISGFIGKHQYIILMDSSTVLSEEAYDGLQESVNEYMRKGYVPVGGIAVIMEPIKVDETNVLHWEENGNFKMGEEVPRYEISQAMVLRSSLDG